MKILVLSDIHANYEALLSIDKYVRECDYILCLGDIVGYSCAVNECIDYVRKHNFLCIQGNHERYVIEGMDGQKKVLNESVRFGINHALRVITAENLSWIKSLPLIYGFRVDNISMMMAHGSPFDPINGYVYENNTNFENWNQFVCDFLFVGHTHRELTHRTEHALIVNPGSIGQSRDCEGRACACILDTETKGIERLKIEYDYMKNLNHSVSFGAGEWIYKHYQTLLM